VGLVVDLIPERWSLQIDNDLPFDRAYPCALLCLSSCWEVFDEEHFMMKLLPSVISSLCLLPMASGFLGSSVVPTRRMAAPLKVRLSLQWTTQVSVQE
jgi:hypothetical protein